MKTHLLVSLVALAGSLGTALQGCTVSHESSGGTAGTETGNPPHASRDIGWERSLIHLKQLSEQFVIIEGEAGAVTGAMYVDGWHEDRPSSVYTSSVDGGAFRLLVRGTVEDSYVLRAHSTYATSTESIIVGGGNIALVASWFDGQPIEGTAMELRLLDRKTGELVREGPSRLKSDVHTGAVDLDALPDGPLPAIHIEGGYYTIQDTFGGLEYYTYDTVLLDFAYDRGDRKLRVPLVRVAETELEAADIDPAPDRAMLSGRVFWTKDGERQPRAVGCARVFLDDDATGLDEETDQRYGARDRIAMPRGTRAMTGTSGQFFFGNLPRGEHTLRVALAGDSPGTKRAAATFRISMANEDARGPQHLILYQLGIDIEAEEDPTPLRCLLEDTLGQ